MKTSLNLPDEPPAIWLARWQELGRRVAQAVERTAIDDRSFVSQLQRDRR